MNHHSNGYCSETSAYIIQTPGNYPKENIIYSEHGEFEIKFTTVTSLSNVDIKLSSHGKRFHPVC